MALVPLSFSFFYDGDPEFPQYKEQFKAEYKPFDRLMDWQYWSKITGIPISPQLYQQILYNKKLYKQIKTLEFKENNTIVDLFKAVTSTKDLRFTVQNVEARIAREIVEQIEKEKLKPKLWQMYIKYL
uniref:Uncharacterized protein n=1 Tax=Panagrolaimus davidi TaxID=227884 RepID=A0A914QT63_9BILA